MLPRSSRAKNDFFRWIFPFFMVQISHRPPMKNILIRFGGNTMDKFEKGTILYDLQPFCDALLPVMRNEKEKQGKTYQHISDTTGITMDNIKRFYSGEHKQPSVYKIAALCKYFGLSMDALFGFIPSAKTVAYTELEQKDAEIEALQAELKGMKEAMSAQQVEYQGRIAEYKELLADMKADKAEYKTAMKRKNRIIRILGISLGILVFLVLALLLTDVLTNHTGWIRL
jgi:transcriptional regulator with XRE-family HTH domain